MGIVITTGKARFRNVNLMTENDWFAVYTVTSTNYSRMRFYYTNNPPELSSLTYYYDVSAPVSAHGIAWSHDGRYFFQGTRNAIAFLRYDFPVTRRFTLQPFEDSPLPDIYVTAMPFMSSSPRDIIFRQDGRYVYVADSVLLSATYFQYTLSSPYGINSASLIDAFSYSAAAPAIYVSHDGTRLYTGKQVLISPGPPALYNTYVLQWRLATNYDLNSRIFEYEFDVRDILVTSFAPANISFSEDGRYCFLTNRFSRGWVNRFTLSTPWDLRTIVVSSPTDGFYFNESSGIGLKKAKLLDRDRVGILT